MLSYWKLDYPDIVLGACGSHQSVAALCLIGIIHHVESCDIIAYYDIAGKTLSYSLRSILLGTYYILYSTVSPQFLRTNPNPNPKPKATHM